MFKNLFKIGLRNLWNQRLFSAINVLGLGLGMACCFLVILYVSYEHSYDRFDENADRLYRVQYHANFGNEFEVAAIPPPFGPLLPDYFPEIEASVRLFPRNVSITVPENQRQIELERVYFADSLFTTVFDVNFIAGDADNALKNPFSIVVTMETAELLFGSVDVLGKGLQLADRDDFTITGVIEDWPDNSHIAFNMLAPYDNMYDLEPEGARASIRQNHQQNKVASHSPTYVLLKENQLAENVNAKFDDFLLKFGDERFRDKQSFNLFPVKDIHLYSNANGEPRPTANLDYLYLFMGIGLITLFIACINFINLSTAGSMNRAKEVGVRKIMGSGKRHLVGQFLGESLLLSFVAFLISLLLVKIGLPFLNDLTDLQIKYTPTGNLALTAIFAAIFLVVGVLAGSYPAFFVSRFKSVTVLKGSKGNAHRPGGALLRKSLITLQFLAAVVFIGGAMSIFGQLNYLRNRPLGFNKDLILSVPISSANFNAVFRPGDPQIRKRMNQLDETLMNHTRIKAVTQCQTQPGFGAVNRRIWTDEINAEENLFVSVLAVDYDYVETFELQITAGRDFDVSYGTDHLESFVINQQAVKTFKWESPEAAIGQRLVVEGKEGKVVGVVKDYNFQSLRESISPLIMEVNPGVFSYYSIRIENSDIPNTIAYIESQWQKYFPAKVFEYTFLEEALNNTYRLEEALSSMVTYFAFIAIFISCFGLFGLAALTTKQRFKEIGVRKVLGASAGQVLLLLSQDFLKLVGIGIIVATPITWYLVNGWLAGFANHIDFPWLVYVFTGIGVLLLAAFTICYQAIKAAMINPVESIRYE